jgi:predicted TIM-barrel fold metal-dependent hydrolase
MRVFDADNHYYEAIDAFTRHLDPRLGEQVIQWCEINGRKYHVIGGTVNHAVVNPTFDPIAKAGAMAEYFRGNPSGRNPLDYLREREPIRPEYRDRDARLEVMDRQELDKIWLFPTLGMVYEAALAHDPRAVGQLYSAFNRWLEEDWGYAYRDRIFAAPYIALADPKSALADLDRALEGGARIVCMRPAAPTTTDGPYPPGHPIFDPFWARVNEAGVPVIVHAGDSGYSANGYSRKQGLRTDFKGGGGPSVTMLWTMERPIFDFLASLILDRVFQRFPNVRVVSVENGSEFLGDLFRKLRSVGRKIPGLFPEDPVETFKRHIWINPFWEDDLIEVVDLMGADRVVFGSDWPHIEGLPHPRDYQAEVKVFDPDTQAMIMGGNAEELNTPRPS